MMKCIDTNLFRASTAALILGRRPRVIFQAASDKQAVYTEAIDASRNLLRTLQCEVVDSGVLSVSLEKKRSAAQQFLKAFGFAWPF